MKSFTSETPVRLNAGYADRLRVKALGAAPHYESGKFQYWVVPPGMDLAPFSPWLPSSLLPIGNSVSINDKSLDRVSGTRLSNILMLVKGTLEANLSPSYWIVAETIHVTGGNHTYIELVDYDERGAELAKVRATIFSSQREILQKFKDATGLTIGAGMKLLFRASIQFHEKFGLSLNILEIDHRFTIGDMEAKIIKIKDELTKKGIISNNKRLNPPVDFNRIIVIAPNEAAGLGDFKSTANVLERYGLCRFSYFPATFQGDGAIASLSAALDQIKNLIINQNEQYDACVIIRGGGDKAGLYTLNDIRLAARICMFPIPVMIGIGHERDETILDFVACESHHTPSLLISHIESTIIQRANQAKEFYSALASAAVTCIHRIQLAIDDKKTILLSSASLKVNEFTQLLQYENRRLFQIAAEKNAESLNFCKLKMTELLSHHPKKILDKGYSIVRDSKGNISGNVSNLKCGENITLTFRDGSAIANLTQVEASPYDTFD